MDMADKKYQHQNETLRSVIESLQDISLHCT
jgi:hypothetical protein